MNEFSLSYLSMGIYVFVLASFIGFEVTSKVPTMLHTPLMSGSNAISGIILLGAIIVAARQNNVIGEYISYLAIFLATINVVGGFFVTDRMLSMFRPKKRNM
jgi:H+-translocating NAD(P) transhydrogenase subunit alpha